MGTIQSDSGASIRDTFKAGGKFGFCLESTWPYTISKFKTKPTQQCYTYATGTTIQEYARVPQDLQSFKRTLAENNPIVFGFAVYESFEGKAIAETGIFTYPVSSEKMVGGHAVVLVGYDDATQCFIVRNSWGNRWGDKGYFYMPYGYVIDPNFSFDFWTLKKVP
jgi:C1A family cysteine protease